MQITITNEQADQILYWAEGRYKSCAGVLTDDYLAQFPVANTPENLAERRAELKMLQDLMDAVNTPVDTYREDVRQGRVDI